MSAKPQLAQATHIVIKPFSGPGNTEFKPGDRVDASEWPKTEKLVSQRYLRPIEATEEAEEGSDAARLQSLEQQLFEFQLTVEAQAKQIAELQALLPKKKVKEVPDGNQSNQ